MRRSSYKWLMLAALLVALLLVVVSCLIQPDKTTDVQPTQPVNLQPFQMTTPPPTAAPTVTTPGQGGTGQDGWGTVPPTARPSATPLVTRPSQVITAAPTATRPAPTDDGTLRNGSSGQKVRELQQRLKDLEYYKGSVDGDFGDATETALRDFQRQNGLSVDGVAGKNTLTKLQSSSARRASSSATARPTATKKAYATSRPTPKTYTPSTPGKYGYVQLGSSGAAVTRLQNRLKELGYFHGTVNGICGEDTRAAIEAFQKRNGEWVDGVAGPDTQERLYSDEALPVGMADPPSQVASRTLKNGMTGNDVMQLQARLQSLYYYNSSLHGEFDGPTEAAVRAFQQRNGLTVDGAAGETTLSRLYSSNAIAAVAAQPSPTAFRAGATLQLGSTGEEVYRLEERLYDLGFYTGRIDGIYSEEVAQAVRAFQTASKLTVDGKAGSGTQNALYSANAVKASGAADSFATLREGDQGERVSALQTLLTTYGYYHAAVDGKFGNATVTAVQQFQATNGLKVDGVAGPATQQLLYQGDPKRASAPLGPNTSVFVTLKQGMTGADVLNLQDYLRRYGFYGAELNGVFDATTYIAVQAFQARNNLKADGIAGQETLALLFSGDGVPAEGFYFTGISEEDYVPMAALPETAVAARALLRSGDEGQDVFSLQERLRVLGYFSGEPTGTYGDATVSAVKAFQAANGVASDGVAGAATQAQMYAANVVPSGGARTAQRAAVDNRNRELTEQQASGAIQGSLAGGGIAASLDSSVYYAGSNGTLYVRSSSDGEKQVYDGPASYIHASNQGVTFVSDNKILRVPAGGGTPKTLVSAGGIRKLSLIGETAYYQDGGTLVRMNAGGETTILSESVNDFCLDVFNAAAYVASSTGVRRLPLSSAGEPELLVSSIAEQVQLCDSVVFFRSGGSVFRLDDGVAATVVSDEATWMGIYRERVYYIAGDRLYSCDTTGGDVKVVYDGLTAEVSFVAGKVYVTATVGGPVTEMVDVG